MGIWTNSYAKQWKWWNKSELQENITAVFIPNQEEWFSETNLNIMSFCCPEALN